MSIEIVPDGTDFFSRTPERAYELRSKEKLTDFDLTLLGKLLLYAATGNVVVTARQETLATYFKRTVRTVQSSIARLVKHGFIVTQYIRDQATQQIKGKNYNVSNTLRMCRPDSKQANTKQASSNQPNRREVISPCDQPQTGKEPMRNQFQAKLESEVVKRENNTAPATSGLSLSPVVALFVSHGMSSHRASGLVTNFGETRCREALTLLKNCRKKVENKAGWLTECLLKNWGVRTEAKPPSRPKPGGQVTSEAKDDSQSEQGCKPVCGLPVPSLDDLPSDVYAALETTARAVLLAGSGGELSNKPRLIRGKMLELLIAQKGEVPAPPQAQT